MDRIPCYYISLESSRRGGSNHAIGEWLRPLCQHIKPTPSWWLLLVYLLVLLFPLYNKASNTMWSTSQETTPSFWEIVGSPPLRDATNLPRGSIRPRMGHDFFCHTMVRLSIFRCLASPFIYFLPRDLQTVRLHLTGCQPSQPSMCPPAAGLPMRPCVHQLLTLTCNRVSTDPGVHNHPCTSIRLPSPTGFPD